MWMVRAGESGVYADRFLGESKVALGWRSAAPADKWNDQGEYYRYLLTVYPDWKERKVSISAGQIYRFYKEVKFGDWVVTYLPSSRLYKLGKVKSGSVGHDASDDAICHWRPVDWVYEVSRDSLSVAARNSLGAISTFFLLPREVEEEVLRVGQAGKDVVPQPVPIPTEEAEDVVANELLYEDMQGRAFEFIKDKVNALDWDDMQELVAGLLRAMGYKTKVSPRGSDRGKDIVASPDGFGFENPRIVVEVKHRKGAMGAPEIRAFLGGRHDDDKGLYVSTGGFSKDASYEAERARIRLTLMDLDDLVRALLEHYEDMDPETRQLVPMRRLYWPAA